MVPVVLVLVGLLVLTNLQDGVVYRQTYLPLLNPQEEGAAFALLGLVVVCAVLLTLALVATTWVARRMGFSKEDEITLVFCGSRKSLASGVPMAKVLFASHAVGAIVLPLMVFHQMQLMVCAVLAQRYARRPEHPATQPA